MDKDKKALLIAQVQTDVTLISFFSVISIFFLGALLPEFDTYDLAVKIPIAFLVVATFSFLFSALILANANHALINDNEEYFDKHLKYGYAISEYLGFFLLVLSVPLAMSIVTEDLFIRIVTFTTIMLGMFVYQFMGFSVMEEHFSKNHRYLSLITLLLGLMVFFSHLYNFYFTFTSVCLLAFLIIVTFFAPKAEVQ